jgi:hypothetical protein
MDRIIGRIIDIKNSYTVVINKGYADGVEEDMRFIVYELGEELKDPETSELLGNMEYVKAKVKIDYVGDKFSIAKSYETYTVSPLSAFAALGPREELKELPLSQEIKTKLSENRRDLTVKPGDLVKQILE